MAIQLGAEHWRPAGNGLARPREKSAFLNPTKPDPTHKAMNQPRLKQPVPHVVLLADATYSIQEERIEFRQIAITVAGNSVEACDQLAGFQEKGYVPVAAFSRQDLVLMVKALDGGSLLQVGLRPR